MALSTAAQRLARRGSLPSRSTSAPVSLQPTGRRHHGKRGSADQLFIASAATFEGPRTGAKNFVLPETLRMMPRPGEDYASDNRKPPLEAQQVFQQAVSHATLVRLYCRLATLAVSPQLVLHLHESPCACAHLTPWSSVLAINSPVLPPTNVQDAVCFDVDCTITVNDTLDLLAEFMGVGEEVAALTHKARLPCISIPHVCQHVQQLRGRSSTVKQPEHVQPEMLCPFLHLH